MIYLKVPADGRWFSSATRSACAAIGIVSGCGIVMAPNDQDETVAFLSNAASYGLSGATVERIETHCSFVFVVDDRAYKLKRAIAYSALDYRTVERREAACRAEIALNLRTAQDLYLGVRAIRRMADGNVGFAEAGPVVDWVVVMRRFDQGDLFDHLAEARRLTPELVRVLADEIAGFHATAERTPGFGGAAGLRDAIERNRYELLTVESVLDRASIDSLYTASLAVLTRVADRLDRRRDSGMVRRCHGDLRLANICLFEDRPTLFDAIEFSDAVSCVDVLFDLAFLLMDLQQRGLGLLANILLNRYLDVTGDEEGLAVLPLMLSIRAATRAFSLAAAVRRYRRKGEVEFYAGAASSHLALASSWLEPAVPRLVAIGGVDGSVKTALAYGLATTFLPAPGARVLRASVALHRDRSGEAPKSASAMPDSANAEALYEYLASKARRILHDGLTTIIDASFVSADYRRVVAAVATDARVPFVGLWLGPRRELDAGGATNIRIWHSLPPGAAFASQIATAHLFAHAEPTEA